MNVCNVSDIGLWDAIWARISHKFTPIELDNQDNQVVFVQERMHADRQVAVAKWLKNKELAAKRRAAGRRGGKRSSKTQANAQAKRKQNASKPGRGKGEGGSTNNERSEVISELDRLPNTLRPVVEDWLRYKQERGESYKPQGLKQFVSRVIALGQRHTSDTIKAAMSKAMANSWKGFEHDLGEIEKQERENVDKRRFVTRR